MADTAKVKPKRTAAPKKNTATPPATDFATKRDELERQRLEAEAAEAAAEPAAPSPPPPHERRAELEAHFDEGLEQIRKLVAESATMRAPISSVAAQFAIERVTSAHRELVRTFGGAP